MTADPTPDLRAALFAELGLTDPRDDPNYGAVCDHGSLARSCQTCELAEAEAKVAVLEAAGDEMATKAIDWWSTCLYCRDALAPVGAHRADCPVLAWKKARDDR